MNFKDLTKPKGQPRNPKDKVATQLRKAGIVGGVANVVPVRKGNWQKAKEAAKAVSGVSQTKSNKTRVLTLSNEAGLEMARDKAAGMTNQEIGEKYSCSGEYVKMALNKIFVSSSKGREILKNILLDNSIAMGMQAQAQMEDLTPMQSVVATGIMTQRFIELDKHSQNIQEDVDVHEIEKVGRLIHELEHSIGPEIKELMDTQNDLEE